MLLQQSMTSDRPRSNWKLRHQAGPGRAIERAETGPTWLPRPSWRPCSSGRRAPLSRSSSALTSPLSLKTPRRTHREKAGPGRAIGRAEAGPTPSLGALVDESSYVDQSHFRDLHQLSSPLSFRRHMIVAEGSIPNRSVLGEWGPTPGKSLPMRSSRHARSNRHAQL